MRIKPEALSATAEFQGIDLGDARRVARAQQLAAALAENPAAPFPQAVKTESAREGCYRFLGNEAVTMNALIARHVAQTAKRAAELSMPPLIIIDKTSFVFRGESQREGLERLGHNRQGFDAFFALAVSSADRMPLGTLAIDPIVEPGRTGADGWLRVIEAATPHVANLDPIIIADREADAYELLAACTARKHRFVIRVAGDRLIRETPEAEKELLGDVSLRAPVMLERDVNLSRRSGVGKPLQARRKHPPREGRVAKLAVCACSIVLPKPPKLRTPGLPTELGLQLVRVIEVDPPAGQEPVEWLLFTNMPVDSAAAVAFVVDCYRARWVIEEYFKALKSGCSYEKRQLESKHALLNTLGLLAPLAWRLLALRTLAARDDRTPASVVLNRDEIRVLRLISKDVKLGPNPTAVEALLALASLGGHFKRNGKPGWKTIWTGFLSLQARVEGYLLAKAEM